MTAQPDRRDGGDVTRLLRAWSDGDEGAFERVLPLVYEELHRMAARYLVGERSTISLQTTALYLHVETSRFRSVPGLLERLMLPTPTPSVEGRS